MKLKELRNEKKIEQQDLAKHAEVTVPMMSYIENYKCLPTPPTLNKILEKLDCEISDIYEDKEIYFKKKTVSKPNKKRDVYNVSVRLPNDMREVLTQENLEKLGYHSLKDFIWHCCKTFEKQLKEKSHHQLQLGDGQSKEQLNKPFLTISLHCSLKKIKENKHE